MNYQHWLALAPLPIVLVPLCLLWWQGKVWNDGALCLLLTLGIPGVLFLWGLANLLR